MHRKMKAGEVLVLPNSETWGFLGNPLDQLKTGTCGGHAGAHFHHCSPIAHKGFVDPFEIYRQAVLLDEYGDNDGDAAALTIDGLQAGTSGTGVAKAMAKMGLISEYLWAQRMEDAITWVLTRGPVMIGSNWYSSMTKPTPEGHVRITPAAGIEGGHEWLIRGVNRSRGLALCVNSWGPKWNGTATGRWGGNQVRGGHFLVDMETLGRLFHEDGDAVSAIEKKGK